MAAKKPIEVKVKVEYTEGYQERYTKACLEQLKRRELAKQREMEAVEGVAAV